jgi:hypothetical protein
MIWIAWIVATTTALVLLQQEPTGMRFSEAMAELRSNNSQPGFEPDFGMPLFPLNFDFEDQSRVIRAIELIESSLDEDGWKSLLKSAEDGEYCVTLIADHDVAYSLSTTEVAYLIVIKTLVHPYMDDLAEVRTRLPGIDTSWATSDLGKLEHVRNWAITSSPKHSLVDLQRLVGAKLVSIIVASKLPDAVKQNSIERVRRRSQSIKSAMIPKHILIGPLSGLKSVDAATADKLRKNYAMRILDKLSEPK